MLFHTITETLTMMQNMMVKHPTAQQKFAFNTPEVDYLFPGFTPGEFAVIYGSPSVTSLASLLCVRAQLPTQLGGLSGNVIYIDSGKTFATENVTRFAQLNHINPQVARQRILNFNAFTAYQLTSFIMDKLEEKIQSCNAKLVVVSDIASLFLDNSVTKEEAQKAYGQIISYLVYLAIKHQIIIIATYPSHEGSIRNIALKEMALSKANTVLSYYKAPYTAELNLEKHPTYILGTAEPPAENMSLTSFM
jgi:predicted ATP-dependent serine protease